VWYVQRGVHIAGALQEPHLYALTFSSFSNSLSRSLSGWYVRSCLHAHALSGLGSASAPGRHVSGWISRVRGEGLNTGHSNCDAPK
jgi:hypothetical protein